jgi:hypothetical protein
MCSHVHKCRRCQASGQASEKAGRAPVQRAAQPRMQLQHSQRDERVPKSRDKHAPRTLDIINLQAPIQTVHHCWKASHLMIQQSRGTCHGSLEAAQPEQVAAQSPGLDAHQSTCMNCRVCIQQPPVMNQHAGILCRPQPRSLF